MTLLGWYAAHGRHTLPWRAGNDPYHVYVSEVMLQQTQVKTVLERYYFPFLARFPTLAALAEAPQTDVLKAWEGLGYYTRALNLHRAAQACAPALPDTLDGLLALPGIGRNTAHAILAFGSNQPYPVMEANVRRVLHRLFALGTATDATLWLKAWEVFDHTHPFDHNQAMMDLGALVCTPKAPDCPACPLRGTCAGKAAPEHYPARKAKEAVPTRKRWMIVATDARGAVYLPARQTRLLHGLHAFPQVEPHSAEVILGQRTVPLSAATPLGEVTHTYSHFRLIAEVRLLRLEDTMNGPDWALPEMLSTLPMSRVDRKAAALQPTPCPTVPAVRRLARP